MPLVLSELIDLLGRLHLLDANQIEEARRGAPLLSEPKQLARDLIDRGWLTPYQSNLLLQGRGHELVLGSYVLLDKLGEGGMGAVFRARNWKLGRITAIKIIRKERLTSDDAVRRFYREIRAAALLEHPNVVRAYDADEVNGTHFFAMEFVEGVDLAKLVREYGPLPPRLACEYVRQAAIGLQHAHERSLVHRDIKPANLLLAPGKGGGTIKLLDLGLARLDAASEESASLTQVGAVMGTPDFMAPEQSISAKTVDVRGDLYSLGCTLYFLLTGKVPFPGTSLTDKLLKHQFEQPQPLELLRPDTPSAVADVVYKLMAKKREDRFQAPAELVAALADVIGNAGNWREAAPAGRNRPEPIADQTLMQTDPFWARIVADTVAEPPARPATPVKRSWLIPAAAGSVLALVVIAVTAVIIANRRAQPIVASNGAPPSTPADVKPASGAEAKSPLDQLDQVHIPEEERFSLQPKELVAVIGEHRQRLWGGADQLAASADGRLIATGEYLYDANSLRLLDRFEGRQHVPPRTIFFSPDGKLLSGDFYHVRTMLWNVAGPKAVFLAKKQGFGNLRPWGFTTDSRFLLVNQNETLFLFDSQAQEPGKKPNAIPSIKDVFRAALAADGKTLFLLHYDKTLRRWEFDGTSLTERGKLLDMPDYWIAAESYTERGIVFDPRSRRMALHSKDGKTWVWDLAEEKPRQWVLEGENKRHNGLAWQPGGHFLARTILKNKTEVIQLWNTDEAQPRIVSELSMPKSVHSPLVFRADGKSLVAANGSLFLEYEVASTGITPKPAPRPSMGFIAVGEKVCAVAEEDGVRLWDLTGTAPRPKGLIEIMDPTGKPLIIGGKRATAQFLAFSPDNRTLYVQLNRYLLRYDVTRETPRPLAPLATDAGPVAVGSDGKKLAVWASTGIHVYNVVGSEAELSAEIPITVKPGRLVLSPDGTKLAASISGEATIWDLSQSPPRELEKINMMVTSWSRSGILAGHVANKMFLWSETTREGKGPPLPPGRREQGNLVDCVATPDGKHFIEVDTQSRVLVRDSLNGVLRKEVELPGIVRSIALAPDGRHLATANGNDTIYFLRLSKIGK